MSIWSGRPVGIPCWRMKSINDVDRNWQPFKASTSSMEAERGGPWTGSFAKGAGGEGVGSGDDVVLYRVKRWKSQQIAGCNGDSRNPPFFDGDV
jgi:hypothetical protein